MKLWLTGVIGSMGLVALLALPPARFDLPTPRRSAEQMRLDEVLGEVRRTHGALRALRWSDSLSALALRTAVDGIALSPPSAAELDPGEVRLWEDATRATLDALEPRDRDLVVGIFRQPARHGTIPDVPLGGWTREVTLIGEREAQPYCIQVDPYVVQTVGRWMRYGGRLSSCRLYAQYGRPGRLVQDWMEASSLGFARTDDLEELADLSPAPPRGTLRLFGMARPIQANVNLAVQACLAGRADACARAVTDRELIAPRFGDEAWLVAHSPASSFGSFIAEAPFGHLDDGLLYEVEAQFGTEAFARFWTSEAPVPEAFEASFGVPLGEWVLDWVQGHMELYRPGPAVPWSALGWSLLALAVLAGVATASAERRRVG